MTEQVCHVVLGPTAGPRVREVNIIFHGVVKEDGRVGFGVQEEEMVRQADHLRAQSVDCWAQALVCSRRPV